MLLCQSRRRRPRPILGPGLGPDRPPPLMPTPSLRLLELLVVLGVLVTLLTEIQSKGISKKASLDFANKAGFKKNSSSTTNELIPPDNDDDGDFLLAYSGYLRGNSSMIDPRMENQNFTRESDLVSHSNSTNKTPKVNGHRRLKRGVTHLYNMILCATGCNPLAYKGYGCYCGFLGSGYPMDGIDRCCKMHDWCYDATDCPMFIEYFVPYYWKCYQGYKPICAIEHGEWGSSGSCAQRLCECDRSFAECLRRYPCPRHKAVCTSSPWRLIQNIFMII